MKENITYCRYGDWFVPHSTESVIVQNDGSKTQIQAASDVWNSIFEKTLLRRGSSKIDPKNVILEQMMPLEFQQSTFPKLQEYSIQPVLRGSFTREGHYFSHNDEFRQPLYFRTSSDLDLDDRELGYLHTSLSQRLRYGLKSTSEISDFISEYVDSVRLLRN